MQDQNLVTVLEKVFFGNIIYEWRGTSVADEITGFNGQQNFIYGDGGDDILSAGKNAPQQLLFGEGGNDTLKGGLTGDTMNGGVGADLMMGGQGDDTYSVDDIGDVIIERQRWLPTGFGDRVSATIDFSLEGLAVEVLILDGDAIYGTGNNLQNRIIGGGVGNHTLDGGGNIDTLFGGRGDDTYILRHKESVATEVGSNARQKTLGAEQGGHDTVLAHNSFKLMLGIEDIILQDVVGKTGQAVNGLTAIGNNLDNLVQGNATDNSLNGRTGNDTLTGNAGADDFIFSDALGAQHADTITDFATGEDRVVIKGSLIAGSAKGVLDADAFHLGAAAQDADDRFIFDGETLWFDVDGSGAEVAVEIAYFEGDPTLTADDIFII